MKRIAERALTPRRGHQSVRGQLLKCLKERLLHLVEDVEVFGAQNAYPKDCFVLGFQHHHGAQLLAAVMARWPSFSRFGSSQLPRNCLSVAVLTLTLQSTYAPVTVAGI